MQPCHVVYTDFRPTPLQHYLFPRGGNGIYLVVDDSGKFREENYQKAMAVLEIKKGDKANAIFDGKGKKGKSYKGGANGEDEGTAREFGHVLTESANRLVQDYQNDHVEKL